MPQVKHTNRPKGGLGDIEVEMRYRRETVSRHSNDFRQDTISSKQVINKN